MKKCTGAGRPVIPTKRFQAVLAYANRSVQQRNVSAAPNIYETLVMARIDLA